MRVDIETVANTTEPSVCGSNAGSCQITFDHLL